MRRLAIVVAALAALSGCGEKVDVLRPSTERPFQVMLDYFPNADHAPIYSAQAGGEFKAAGLDLKIRQPADPSAPIKQVAAGRVDLAISYDCHFGTQIPRGAVMFTASAPIRFPTRLSGAGFTDEFPASTSTAVRNRCVRALGSGLDAPPRRIRGRPRGSRRRGGDSA